LQKKKSTWGIVIGVVGIIIALVSFFEPRFSEGNVEPVEAEGIKGLKSELVPEDSSVE